MKAQRFSIHPENPQRRLGSQAAKLLKKGGVIVYPTDSYYALGCMMGNAKGVSRIRLIRNISVDHHLTIAIKDLSEISSYAMLGNSDFRFLKSCMPGPFTFIMRATKQVPVRLAHPKKKTIGLRNIDSKVVSMLLEELDEPLITSSFDLGGEGVAPYEDMDEIYERAKGLVDLVVDSGPCPNQPTTVIDMTENPYALMREGAGKNPSLMEKSA